MANPVKGVGSERKAAHSIRCTDEMWARAKRRATSEGVTMNHVINEIMDGYARGLVNLPRVTKSYAAPASTATPPAAASS